MKPHEKHFQIVEMYHRGRPFLDIDKELGLRVYESRRYLIDIGLFEMAKVSDLHKKLKEGEEW